MRLPARQSDQGVSSLLHAADAAHHGHHGRILRPQHRRDVDLPRSHDPLRRRHRLPPPHGAGARSDVEIHLRLLGRHRHGLSGHPAALVAGRRFAALRGAGAQRRRRQPALPENRLSADPLRLQLQDGDFPALHDRRRRQFRRAGTRLSADLDGAGQRRLSGRFPRLSHHGADRSDRLGTQRTAADGHSLAGRGRAVPAAHEQLQALPLLLHGREHGHRRDRTGHRRHRRLGRGVPRRLPHASQEQPLPANGRRAAHLQRLPHQPHR